MSAGELWVHLLRDVANNAFDQWHQVLPPPAHLYRCSDSETRCAQEVRDCMRRGFPALDVCVDTHDGIAPFVDVVARVRRMPYVNEVQAFWEKKEGGHQNGDTPTLLQTFFSELSFRRVGNGYIMTYTPRRPECDLFWIFGGRKMSLHANSKQVPHGFPFPKSPLACSDNSSETHIVATVHAAATGKIISRQIVCLEGLEEQNILRS